MSNSLKLKWFERVGKSFLDEWVAPWLPAIPDLACFDPSIDRRSVLLDVPGVTQVHTYSCGATASWSVLSALGWDADLEEWIDTCHNAGMHPDQGMDERQLNRALRSLGAKLRTVKYRDKNQVKKLIDKGQPMLFGIDDNGEGEGDHWQYVYGYNARHVFVGNIVRPGASKGRMSWGDWSSRLVPRELYLIESK